MVRGPKGGRGHRANITCLVPGNRGQGPGTPVHTGPRESPTVFGLGAQSRVEGSTVLHLRGDAGTAAAPTNPLVSPALPQLRPVHTHVPPLHTDSSLSGRQAGRRD